MIAEELLWPQRNPPEIDLEQHGGNTAAEAFRYAKNFVERFVNKESFSFELAVSCPPPGCTPEVVKEFLEGLGVQFVKMSIEEDGYASWVMPLGRTESDGAKGGDTSKIYIAIDPDQIAEWKTVTG